jgi:hypothetical protein
MERQQSFFLTGGLVAVHSPSRDRGSIWDALNRRQVYATSGDRILLWFDLLNGPAGPLPMGSEVAMGQAPRFRVSAAGDFKQLPGCPDYVSKQLGAERQASLCAGECYNPGDERRAITRDDVPGERALQLTQRRHGRPPAARSRSHGLRAHSRVLRSGATRRGCRHPIRSWSERRRAPAARPHRRRAARLHC